MDIACRLHHGRHQLTGPAQNGHSRVSLARIFFGDICLAHPAHCFGMRHTNIGSKVHHQVG